MTQNDTAAPPSSATLYLGTEVIADLQTMADAERRSLSQMARFLLEEAIEARKAAA